MRRALLRRLLANEELLAAAQRAGTELLLKLLADPAVEQARHLRWPDSSRASLVVEL